MISVILGSSLHNDAFSSKFSFNKVINALKTGRNFLVSTLFFYAQIENEFNQYKVNIVI